MKLIAATAGLVGLLYITAALSLYLMQRKFIYYPTPVVKHQLPEIVIEAMDGARLNIVVGNAGKNEAVIYFGGNAESIANSAPDLAAHLSDKTIYLVNYRGYGGSDGTPTESNLFKDAEVIFDTIAATHSEVSVIGRSLGTGVACWLAAERPVKQMVLITPFDSMLNIAKKAYTVFPVSWLLKDKYRSIEYAPDIKIPVLVILAGRDRVIPADSSHRLIQAFSQAVEVSVLEYSDHNDIQMHNTFYSLIKHFLS